MRQPWTEYEVRQFLRLNPSSTADYVARRVGRSRAAIQGMRRKLKRLRALGVIDHQELVQLLQVHENVVLHTGLKAIRRRAAMPLVPMKRFVRRARVTGKPHLVGPYKRNKAGA